MQPFDARPDVPLEDLRRSLIKPDVGLGELTVFETVRMHRKSRLREWTESLVSVFVFVLLFTNFVAQATQVPTESMKPSILVGDHFFLDKLAFPGNYPQAVLPYLPERTIQHGDIIAFKSPVDGNIPFVKRVIAVSGDTVEIRDKITYVNGRKIDEPYKIHVDSTIYGWDAWTPEERVIRDNFGPETVPPDSFFVLGDNRDNSQDSRYWGFVDRNSIIGKPLFVYWSYESDPYIPGERSFRDWMYGYISVAANFFSKTRWFRIGTMVR